ncbi:MAG: hypothetical protein GXP63_03415 [DPANN group archaeon]|nr:hypothetical protein [DPANN group archaeon]
MEFFLAIAIFTLAVLLFHRYDILDRGNNEQSYVRLVNDAQAISDMLLGAGFPAGWNASTVVKIGLTNDDQRIDETKLAALEEIPYEQQRLLLGTEYEFSFRLLTNNLTTIRFFNSTVDEFGTTGIGDDPLTNIAGLEQLITIERAVIVDQGPGLLRLYVWRA